MLGTLVRETATAPGTGTTVTLTGATAGRRTFVSEFGSAASCFYFITDGTQTEAQIGTVSAGPPATLTRGTPVWTSAAGATSPTRLNFTAAVVVYAQLPGQRAVYTNNSGDLQGVTAAKVRAAAGATTVGEAVLTAASEAAARAAIGAANKAGDTLTGDLAISKATPTLALNKPSAGSINGLVGRSNSLDRWRIELGNATAESGSNVGSDFIIARFNDAGTFIDVVLTIYRSTGAVAFGGDVNVIGALSQNGNAVQHVGIAAGAVGSLVLAKGSTSTIYNYGDTISGSALTACNASGQTPATAPTLSGTWRCLGQFQGSLGWPSVFLRIS